MEDLLSPSVPSLLICVNKVFNFSKFFYLESLYFLLLTLTVIELPPGENLLDLLLLLNGDVSCNPYCSEIGLLCKFMVSGFRPCSTSSLSFFRSHRPQLSSFYYRLFLP